MSSEENFTNIYINNLDNSVNEVSLRQLCERICGIGTVKTLVIFKARNEHSMGYGFCNFVNHQCALKAINYMNNMIIGSKKISAARATPKNDRDQYKRSLSQLSRAPELNANVYIKNFDSFVNEEFLRNAFSRFGTIINVRIMRNLSGFSKGFGFVSFTRHEDALNAIKGMNGKQLAGRTISVDFYTPKNSRRIPENENRLSSSSSSSSSSPINLNMVSNQSSISSSSSSSLSGESSPELLAAPIQNPEIDFGEYDINENNIEENGCDEGEREFNEYGIDINSEYDTQEILSEQSDYYETENEIENNVSLINNFDFNVNQNEIIENDNNEIFTPFIPNLSENNFTKKQTYKIIVHNLRYVFDEKEVRKIFYDFKDFKVKQILNSRKLPTGDWKVTFTSENDMRRALSICNTLIVRGQKVYANEYIKMYSQSRLFKKKTTGKLHEISSTSPYGFSDMKTEPFLKTSLSSPSTPQFKPGTHSNTLMGANENIFIGEKENNDVIDTKTCKKRSMSLTGTAAATATVPPPAFNSNFSFSTLTNNNNNNLFTFSDFNITSFGPTQGCKSCNEQMIESGIYNGPLSSLNYKIPDDLVDNTLIAPSYFC